MSDLTQRMKENFEVRAQTYLPRRCPVILRIDGKAFHTFTKNCKRPFDKELMEAMDKTTIYLAENIQGAQIGYTESDEISILITDYTTINTDAWFSYNVQKMTSIAASMATAKFNSVYESSDTKYVSERDNMGREVNRCLYDKPLALFDARVFSIPDLVEVANYFIDRQKDCERNSIQMVAQSMYSQKELHKKKIPQIHEMLYAKGINWNDYATGEKRGRLITKSEADGWRVVDTPIFAQDRAMLESLIPQRGY